MATSVPAGIFKAYDVRGKVGSELSRDSVEHIGRAFGDWLPKAGVVAVGRDMRPDSKELADALIAGLTAQGRTVWDIGEVTSDMIYFTVGHFNLAGGAMITASHNPGEYNGIKFCREEAKPIGLETGLLEIRDLSIAGTYKTTDLVGLLEQKDVGEAWIEHVLSFIDASQLKPLKIAVDAGNGMAGKIFPRLEQHVPFKVQQLYFELDGTFPNHIANPLDYSTLADLQAAIRDNGLDAGLAFDGDGDRAAVLDEFGEPLTGTVMTALLAEYFLKQFPGATILYNAICGRAASEAIAAAGGTGVRTRVGHSFIKQDMRTHNAVFAGEHSGHYYFKNNFMADSGLIAAIVALEVIGASGKSVSELVAPYRNAYAQIRETNFEVSGDKEALMKQVAEAFAGTEQDWLDGLTVSTPSGWVNVRPSNTEPLLRLNAEAKTQAELDQLVTKVTSILQA